MSGHLSTKRSVVREKIQRALEANQYVLPEPDAKSLLARFGISVPSSVLIENEMQVDHFLASLPGPYVLKAVGKTIVHKTEIGAVKVDLPDLRAVKHAIANMREQVEAAGHSIDTFLVELMEDPGVEIVLGAVRKPNMGWVVMLGLGGIFVEVLEDVSFGFAPITRSYADQMLSQLRGARVLDGIRGLPGVKREELLDIITAFAGESGFLDKLPKEVSEVDLNPIICNPSRCTVVDARIVLQPNSNVHPIKKNPAVLDYERLIDPEVIAVLGPSESSNGMANDFIRRTKQYGYKGRIYPVHHQADSIEGLKAYRTLNDIPENIDYAYVALPAKAVAPMLDCSPGKLAVAQIASSGFSETSEGEQFERDLAMQAQRGLFRYLGPNCLGIHSVKSRVTFVEEPSAELGNVAVISQSGGLSVDIIRQGSALGIKFKAVLSVGNSEDVPPAELLELMLQDAEIKAIGLYLESLTDAVLVQRVLAASKIKKPIVLLAGGRTQAGADSAASHTGALVSDYKLWPAIAHQSGLHLVESLHEFVHLLAAFECIPSDYGHKNREAILFGNGGGSSVLGSDALSNAGLQLSKLSRETVMALEAAGNLVGSSLSNPIDVPAPVLSKDNGQLAKSLLRIALSGKSPAAVAIVHLNVGVLSANRRGSIDVTDQIIKTLVRLKHESSFSTLFLLVLRSDGIADTDALIRNYRLLSHPEGIPVFDDVSTAAIAADALIRHNYEGADIP